MSYDEGLAERIREILQDHRKISERKMFGGIDFMTRGYMLVGIVDDVLMARVGREAYEEALTLHHVRLMEFTGKPMNGYVFVDPPGLERDADLTDWIERCHGFVQSLLPKNPKRSYFFLPDRPR